MSRGVKSVTRKYSNSIINAARKASYESGLTTAPHLDGFHGLVRANKLEINLDDEIALGIAKERYCLFNRTDFEPVRFNVEEVDDKNKITSTLYHADLCSQEPSGFVVKNAAMPGHPKLMQVALPRGDTLQRGEFVHHRDLHETQLAKIQTANTGMTLFKVSQPVKLDRAHMWVVRKADSRYSSVHRTRSTPAESSSNKSDEYVEVEHENKVTWKLLSCLGLAYESETAIVKLSGRVIASIKPKVGWMQPKKTLVVHFVDDVCPQEPELRAVIMALGLLVCLTNAYPSLKMLVDEAIIKKISCAEEVILE